ncbi:XrtA/PEP-CTERM system histidine kinase PrsK [Mangrovitalea sediminis]|uniref:XrtA/PEP-CTERM system histidine kinase PrsK n=1 Tax=Mangrovitalea sediminis TaxID=1982043 RepID=UPI000BE543BD|nr:XrtA/PEP-CTERM system histidine kinase PrsK [Mangrovitalea sediminis]
MTLTFGAVSHTAAALAFLLLGLLVSRRYLRRYTDRALLVAALLSATWAAALAAQSVWGQPPFVVRYGLELARDASWITVLITLIRDSNRIPTKLKRLRITLFSIIGLALLTLFASAVVENIYSVTLIPGKVRVIAQMAIALFGLSLVEQIWRNSVTYGRSSIKYVCIAIGAIFVYDFFMYAEALLFNQISSSMWDARGAINALVAPLFAVNMINARKQPIELQFSRNLVFHAGTLIAAGIYLLIVSAGGYYVRVWGGSWGEALQILFMTTFVLLFTLLITSSRLRSRAMLMISKNFFDYKYDYRDEWLKITQFFSNLGEEPPLTERTIRILASLVDSHSGALWLRDDEGHFLLATSVNMQEPKHTEIDLDCDLVRFFQEREWVLDLREYQNDPVRYNLLEIPDAILNFPDKWLIVPLYLGNELYGIVLIGEPYTRVELNWENFDLIRVVARQTCNFLAQSDAQSRLSRAMQFEAVNKASAFMVHDLKTLIAQLSLLVRNAPKHRENPAFIDDMIRTTEHAVNKMSNLVEHIKKPSDEARAQVLDLPPIVRDIVSQQARQKPEPIYVGPETNIHVKADPDQLRGVLGHLVQNAQDATPRDGEVSITLKTSLDHVVLFIQDSGSGMTEDFIKTRLFKPFESTKGLTGMGIGAYQAREYIRKIGGNIDVTSEPGVGSCFSVRIPLNREADQANAAA